MKKIAIVGSRDFLDLNLIKEFVTTLPKDTVIISGGARGVDSTAEVAAAENGLETKIFYPEWEKYGKSAGFIRNKQIVDEADEVYAFWDGKSRGTKNTIDTARKDNKVVVIFGPDSKPQEEKNNE